MSNNKNLLAPNLQIDLSNVIFDIYFMLYYYKYIMNFDMLITDKNLIDSTEIEVALPVGGLDINKLSLTGVLMGGNTLNFGLISCQFFDIVTNIFTIADDDNGDTASSSHSKNSVCLGMLSNGSKKSAHNKVIWKSLGKHHTLDKIKLKLFHNDNVPLVYYDWSQLGVNDDMVGINGDLMGSKVAINGVGNIVACASRLDDDGGINSGSITIFEYNGSNWVIKGARIDGETAGDEATAVAISNDGLTIAMGGYNNDVGHFNSGVVRVYDFTSGGGWVKRGASIYGVEPSPGSYESLGVGIEISDDGNILAIGSTWYDTNRGYAIFYEWVEDEVKWVKKGQTLFGIPPNGNFTYLNIGLSNDGLTFIAGTPNPASSGGISQVYYWSASTTLPSHPHNGTWVQRGDPLGGQAGENLGLCNRLNGDGLIYATSAPYYQGGYVDVFTWNGVGHTRLGKRLTGDAVDDRFGYEFDLSDDGHTLAIGTNKKVGYFKIFNYDIDSGKWVQKAKIDGESDGSATTGGLGQSIRLNKLGDRVVVGHPNNDSSTGTDGGEVQVYENARANHITHCILTFDAQLSHTDKNTINNIN